MKLISSKPTASVNKPSPNCVGLTEDLLPLAREAMDVVFVQTQIWSSSSFGKLSGRMNLENLDLSDGGGGDVQLFKDESFCDFC